MLRGVVHDGVWSFFTEYLERSPFVGREALLAHLEALPAGTSALLCAPAGRGKSALLMHLARRLDEAGEAVAWVPISLRYGTHRSVTVEELLTARVRALLGGQIGLRERMEGHQGKPLWVIVDGLDELQDEALLGSLTGLSLSPSVRLVLSSRAPLDLDAGGWVARLRLSSCQRLTLDPLSSDEVACYPGLLTQVAEVMRRTGGDPLLIALCKKAIDQGEALPDVSDPAELVGAWWADQRARLSASEGRLSGEALAALAAACGVVPWAVLAAVVGVEKEALQQALAPFTRFLIEVEGQGVAFAHPKLAELCRWMDASEVQRAQTRFAELALSERQKEDPHPYFLHFALAHLQAAGAPDEAIHGLVSLRSLEAWHGREGAVGFLPEIRASHELAVRAVRQRWGTEEASGPLRQQSRCLALEELANLQECSMTSELRAALLSHGVRSVQETLKTLSDLMIVGDCSSSIEAIAPLIPDQSLSSFLALEALGDWPFASIAQELLRRGRKEQAVASLVACPVQAVYALDGLAASLQPDDIERIVEAIFESEMVFIDGRLEVAHLSAERGLHEIEQAELLWHQTQEEDLASSLLGAHTARGDLDRALDWAERLLRFYLDNPYEDPDLRGWIQLIERCQERQRPRLNALLDEIEAHCDLRGAAAIVLACAPHREPSPKLLSEIDQSPWRFWKLERLSSALWPRCEAALERQLRTRKAHENGDIYSALEARPLSDRGRFFETPLDLTEATRETLSAAVRAIAAHDSDETRELVLGRLGELRRQGAALWEIDGWERFFSYEERLAVLRSRLREPLISPEPTYLRRRLGKIANTPEINGSPAQQRLLSLMRRMDSLKTTPQRTFQPTEELLDEQEDDEILLGLIARNGGLWASAGERLRRRLINAIEVWLQRAPPSKTWHQTTPQLGALAHIIQRGDHAAPGWLDKSGLTADEVFRLGQHMEKMNASNRIRFAFLAQDGLCETGEERWATLLERYIRSLKEEFADHGSHLELALSLALWRVQGSSADQRLAAALEKVDAEASCARVLKRSKMVSELGLSAAVLRRLLPTAEPAEAFSLLHHFWSHLNDEERKEFQGTLWRSATACKYLKPLDDMTDFVSDGALAESWCREVLGNEWVMPTRLLRRAGGEKALEAWIQGVDEVFGELWDTPPPGTLAQKIFDPYRKACRASGCNVPRDGAGCCWLTRRWAPSSSSSLIPTKGAGGWSCHLSRAGRNLSTIRLGEVFFGGWRSHPRRGCSVSS